MREGDAMRLRIEANNGSPVNDYRIVNGHLEFRVLDPGGRPYASPLSLWRALDAHEIQLHHALDTVVSHWLRARIGGVSTTNKIAVKAA